MAQLMNGKAQVIKDSANFKKFATIKVPAMRKMSRTMQNELRKRMTCRLVMAGSTIRMGSGRRDDIFFLVSGRAVGVQNHLNTTTITPLECGNAFVDFAAGVGAAHVKSVIANSNCVVCSLPASVYKQALAKSQDTDTNGVWGLAEIWNMMWDVLAGDKYQQKQKEA